MAGPLIAIADHDPVLIRLLGDVLADEGFESLHLPVGTAAYEEIKMAKPALIILDTWLENREAGWTLFQVLRLDKETKQIPVLICSSDLDEFEKRAASLDEYERVAVLNKPFDVDVLVARIRQMLGRVEAATPGRNGASPE